MRSTYWPRERTESAPSGERTKLESVDGSLRRVLATAYLHVRVRREYRPGRLFLRVGAVFNACMYYS